MVCVYCGASTAVKNSRLQRLNNHVWRRRVCQKCQSTFTSIERPELSNIFVVGDPDGSKHRLEPFSRDRLFLTIYKSCKHRPNAVAEAGSLTQTITNKLVSKRPDGIVSRAIIAKQAYLVLKRFDQAAATLYAAYHKHSEL